MLHDVNVSDYKPTMVLCVTGDWDIQIIHEEVLFDFWSLHHVLTGTNRKEKIGNVLIILDENYVLYGPKGNFSYSYFRNFIQNVVILNVKILGFIIVYQFSDKLYKGSECIITLLQNCVIYLN